MGSKETVKLSVLIFFLLLICLATYSSIQATPNRGKKASLLPLHLSTIGDYTLQETIPLREEHYTMLNLDDYFFADFTGNKSTVNLYVGYYFTADKVTAAHSPLVCFPGQGWTVTPPADRLISTSDGNPIHAAEITATLGEQSSYILYWFQAHHSTSPQIYTNKLRTLYNQFVNNEEQNAFVRVSVPIHGNNLEAARNQALTFIKAFYPQFLTYVDAPFTKEANGQSDTPATTANEQPVHQTTLTGKHVSNV